MPGELPSDQQFNNEHTTDEHGPEVISEKTIEDTLRNLHETNVLINMRYIQHQRKGFFDPNMGYVAEHDQSEAGNVLTLLRDALMDGDEVASTGVDSATDVDYIVTALEPDSVQRRILMAYWMIRENTPWREATGQIYSRQSHRYENFPAPLDIKDISSRLNT